MIGEIKEQPDLEEVGPTRKIKTDLPGTNKYPPEKGIKRWT